MLDLHKYVLYNIDTKAQICAIKGERLWKGKVRRVGIVYGIRRFT